MKNISNVGRYKINVVNKLNLKSKQSQVCIVSSEDVFNYLTEFMKENIHSSNWDYISCGHSIKRLETVRTLAKFLDRKYNKTLKVLYKNPNTNKYQYIPFRSYKLYSKIKLDGNVILLMIPSDSKDSKNIIYKVKRWANTKSDSTV